MATMSQLKQKTKKQNIGSMTMHDNTVTRLTVENVFLIRNILEVVNN